MRVRRSRLRIVLFVVVVPALILLRVLDEVVDDGSTKHDFDAYRQSFAFVIDHERSCTFRLQERPPMVKIVTNATVDRTIPVDENESFEYVLAIHALDDSGEVVERREYTLRGNRTFAFDAHTGRLIPSHLYLEEGWIPTSSKVVMLPMHELPPSVEQIQLRVLHMDPALRDVSVRMLGQDPPPDYKMYYLWHRMSWERKQRVAQFNLYGPGALRTEEIHNLLRARLASIAPVGIAGRDFTRRRIFVYEDSPARRNLARIEPHGRVVSRDRNAVLPVPELGELILWRFRPLDTGEHFAAGDRVELIRTDAVTGARRSRFVELSGGERRWVTDPGGGTVEVRSAVEMVVNLYVFFAGEWVEVTPELRWVPTYLTQWGLPLEYQVSGGVPVRIDARRLLAPGEDVREEDVSFLSFVASDRDGKVLARGDVCHRGGVSRHDAPIGNYRDCRLSRASRHYIRMPEGTHGVRLESFDARMVVSLYTRPDELPRQVRVPDDYDDFARSHDGVEPRPESRAWFPLHPTQSNRWIEENRRLVVGAQRAPREVATRQRSSTAIPARENVPSVPILATTRIRDGFRPWHYTELPGDGSERLSFLRADGAPPELKAVVLKETAAAASIELTVDGRRSRYTVTGRQAELPTRNLLAGSHTIQLSGPAGTRFFVNGASDRERAVYRRRQAQPLADELTFALRHGADEEVVTVHVWVAESELESGSEPLRIRAELDVRTMDGVVTDSWTFRKSEFLIDLEDRDRPGWKLTANVAPVRERVLFLGLGTDVMEGEVVVRLRRVTGPSCLVQLVHGHEGSGDSRSVFSTDRSAERD